MLLARTQAPYRNLPHGRSGRNPYRVASGNYEPGRCRTCRNMPYGAIGRSRGLTGLVVRTSLTYESRPSRSAGPQKLAPRGYGRLHRTQNTRPGMLASFIVRAMVLTSRSASPDATLTPRSRSNLCVATLERGPHGPVREIRIARRSNREPPQATVAG
jgi:hypothetical protein